MNKLPDNRDNRLQKAMAAITHSEPDASAKLAASICPPPLNRLELAFRTLAQAEPRIGESLARAIEPTETANTPHPADL